MPECGVRWEQIKSEKSPVVALYVQEIREGGMIIDQDGMDFSIWNI